MGLVNARRPNLESFFHGVPEAGSTLDAEVSRDEQTGNLIVIFSDRKTGLVAAYAIIGNTAMPIDPPEDT